MSGRRLEPRLSEHIVYDDDWNPIGSAQLAARRIAFCSDIEGNWEYFVAFVELSEALLFDNDHPTFAADGACELSLAPGWHFVHGGDAVDKGNAVGGSVRVVATLLRLKARYPERVTLLLGNRDLNKLRLTSELHPSQLAHHRRREHGARRRRVRCMRDAVEKGRERAAPERAKGSTQRRTVDDAHARH